MKRFFSFDGESYDTHETAAEAREQCERSLCDYREYASSDGWAEEVASILWVPIAERVVETERKTREDFEDPEEARSELRGFDYWADYALRPTEPAPAPEPDETRLLLAQLYAWLERGYESRHVGLPVVVMVPGADGTELDHFRARIYAAITRSTP